mmetsp:Transcript_5799/g.13789  ORF Transcript_5799/g.13789 Transcript_5799/m.13789 type:complete len:476 (-) Transcript_5799:39-1466(-)
MVDGHTIAAEFIGTFVLVLAVGCNVISGNTVWGGVSIASALTVMIYALNEVSGANFNPAVSVALGLAKFKAWPEVLVYVVVQLMAGLVAGLCYLMLFKESFNLEPTKGHSLGQAMLAEVIYTFMLCFVVLNVACSRREKEKNANSYGLAIGFVIVAGAYGAGSISMGCFNPAVAFGIDVASAWFGVYYCVIYAAFELLGAALAAGAFFAVRPEELPQFRDGNNPCSEDFAPPMFSRLFSEFLGTFMLVLTVGLNVLAGSAAAVFSIAASLMCMIFALGTCSGGHFNPAVTVAVLFRGDRKLSGGGSAALKYIVAQILGGLCAAVTYSVMMNGETFPLRPKAYSWPQAFIAEIIFTTILTFVVLSVATVSNPLTDFDGFAVGMCVMVGGAAIGKVSGGSLNPAVSIGISSVHMWNGGSFFTCLAYSLAEMLAGVVASGIFKVTQPQEVGKDSTLPQSDIQRADTYTKDALIHANFR